ncbi:ATP synthase subunit 6 (mitochondrion) [Rhizoctonia solani AG-1 IB]|uniref:ATP synthase subunit a n=1 Tax=Thanatephorus cucumeris (strain AG1-IB / isolate 7/3/14) TaxID=1108050 RepID=M5BMI3_THACB|nr:ATP synthase subunit 6 [Rhizoctonia solani AG-1 IB]
MLNTTHFISSPLEQFEVTNLIGINAPILGFFNLTLTNLALYSIVLLFLTLGLHFVSSNNRKLVPSKWSIALESSFASINTMVRDQIGTANEVYLPFIYSLFFFIIIANLTGNVPYNYTITTSIVVSLGLSFTIFIGVTILALSIHKVRFFSFFIPSGTPLALVPLLVLIELISYLARAVSLGVRLFMKILSTFLFQMFSSSILVAVLTVVPFALFTAIIGLEIGVSIIQAYVFSILVCSYLKDAIDLH